MKMMDLLQIVAGSLLFALVSWAVLAAPGLLSDAVSTVPVKGALIARR